MFGIQLKIQKGKRVNKDIYACFTDFEKAFDKVFYPELLETLVTEGIDDKNVSLIENVYAKQQGVVQFASTQIRIVSKNHNKKGNEAMKHTFISTF